MNPDTTYTRRRILKAGALTGTALSVGGAASAPVVAQEQGAWPMFARDRANSGYAPDVTGPVDEIETQWSVETGAGVPSSPAVAGETVYVGSGDGRVYALSTVDGSEQWTFETGDVVASSPAVADGTVYVGSRDTRVYALAASDGTELWTYKTGGGVFSSPVVVDGTVIVGSRDNTIYALSADDGTERWTYETGGEVWSSPAVADGTVFVGSRDNTLYALAVADGSERWTYETGDWIESPPAVRDGTVYVGSLDTSVYALSATDGTEQWTTQLPDVVASSPAVGDGTVYVGCRDAQVYALAAADGSEQWTFETGGRVFSSPAVTERAVFVGSADSAVYGLSRADGSEQWRYETGERIFSSPAVVDGTVFIGSNDGRIYALGSPNAGTSTGGMNTLLVPAALGAVGLGGGGAWWAYKRRSQRGGTDDSGDSTPAGPPHSAQGQAEAADSPEVDRPTKADRMVPTDIPSTPELSIDYSEVSDETPIGSGGNADVTRATIATDEGEIQIAIKKPRLSGTIQADTIEQLLTEAQTWKELDDHDHIVDVIDYGSTPLPWIAMEYMDGGDLSERIDGIDTDQAIWTALAVTKGVHHAHRQGIAHLDLKPENVLFRRVEDAWDVPKVSDWGLAKELLEHSKSVEGLSPQYAAPEQFSEEYGHADDLTDVYQLGTVFYELFTGRPPFEGPPAKVMRSVLDDQPQPPSDVADVPPALDDILLTALEKSKADRFDSLIYLRDAFQELYDQRLDT